MTENQASMTTAASTAAATAPTKVTLAKITRAVKVRTGAATLARFGNHRQQAANTRAMAFLTDNSSISALIAG